MSTPVSAASGQRAGGAIAWAVLVAAFGGFLFGFDIAVVNGAVNPLQEYFGLNEFWTGFVVASGLLGCVVGAWFGGTVVDRLGRVRSMLVAAVLFLLSAVLSGLALTVYDFVLWRLLGGLGVGLASVIVPAYIAEIAPSRQRGRLGSLWQLAIVIGIFASAVSNALVANLAGGAGAALWFGLESWRWMFMIEALPALIYGLLAITLPESPRYLVSRGREREAKTVLHDVVGIQGEKALAEKVAEVRETINVEARQRLRDLLEGRRIKPIVWVGIGLAVFQQVVGINVIFFYSNTLWQSVGIPEDQAFLVQVITTSFNILATIVGIMIVDRLGRRMPLAVGSLGMAVGLTVMCIAFTQAQVTTVPGGEDLVSLPGSWGIIALVAANVFTFFFGVTWGPYMWLMLGEMFPNRIRAVALGVAAAFNWIANWAVSTFFPMMADVSLVFAYSLYAGCAYLSFLFVLKWVPETKGRELEQMSENAHVSGVPKTDEGAEPRAEEASVGSR